MNKEHLRQCSEANSNEVYVKPLHSQKVTVWSGISEFNITDPYLFENETRNSVTVTSDRYVHMADGSWFPGLRRCDFDLYGTTSHTVIYTWCGYKITGLMLEHLLFKKLHNRNVVTLNVLPSAIPTPLYANFPLLEAMLQVVF